MPEQQSKRELIDLLERQLDLIDTLTQNEAVAVSAGASIAEDILESVIEGIGSASGLDEEELFVRVSDYNRTIADLNKVISSNLSQRIGVILPELRKIRDAEGV